MKESHITKLITGGDKPPVSIIVRAAVFLAFPAVVEQIMLTAVQFVDTAMVGRLGADATAAVGLTTSSVWMFQAVFGSASMGFSVQVAQHLGAGRRERAKQVVAQSLRVVAILGMLLGALGFFISFSLPDWLGAEDAVAGPAGTYFRIIACGMPMTFGVLMVSSMMRCAGDTKTPMILNTMINIINVTLNFLFIYPTRMVRIGDASFVVPGLNLGVAGAAIASITATGTIFIVFLWILFNKEGPIRLTKDVNGKMDRECLGTAFRFGLPIAMERLTMSGAQVMQTSIITDIGTVSLATHHLAVTAESVSYAPAFGVSQAATTMVGQAIGAERKGLAMYFAKISIIMGMILMTFGGMVLFVFAEPLIGFFSEDGEVVLLGGKVLRIVAFAEPLFAAAIVSSGILRGAGDSKVPFIICLSTMWGIRITLSMIFAPQVGLVGVWIAMAMELMIRGSIFLVRVLRGKWVYSGLFKSTKTNQVRGGKRC
ncbi:MAG: MATE family efflux transporter [Firmicutes bacterium]|nr:MATE family efflux transporter [Bacillota bacterium]